MSTSSDDNKRRKLLIKRAVWTLVGGALTAAGAKIFTVILPVDPPLQPPTGLSCHDVSRTSIGLSWHQSGPSPERYEIVQDDTMVVGIPIRPEFQVTELQPETRYRFYVLARRGSETTRTAEETACATQGRAALAAPVNLVNTSATSTAISLQWSPSLGASGYRVMRSKAAASEVLSSSTLAYTDTGLEPQRVYTYTVRAIATNGSESGDSNEVVASTTGGDTGPLAGSSLPPEAPRSLVVTQATQTSVTVVWQQPSFTGTGGLDGYLVFLGTTQVAVTSNTSYTLTGLTAGTTYNIKVAASSRRGLTSNFSNTATAVTSAATVSYPYTVTVNRTLTCDSGCWATDRMTTILNSVTVLRIGHVYVRVTYINHTSDGIDIVFDPPNLLKDASGKDDQAFAADGGLGYIPIPANGSISYTMEFGGLTPPQGTQCVLVSDIEQGGAFTIYYDDQTIPCR